MFPPIDTKSSIAVADATCAAFAEMFPRATPALTVRLFADVDAMFAGRYLDYQPIDTPYHDLEHTLQVTWCLAQILAGRHQVSIEPRLNERQFELAIAAALLHDTGYLKMRADLEGIRAFCLPNRNRQRNQERGLTCRKQRLEIQVCQVGVFEGRNNQA